MAAGMTKTQVVRHIAEKHGIPNKTAAAFLEHLAETAIETKKNGVFVLPGVGRLVKANRKARMGRNPQTGEAIKIPAKTVVKFRVAKAAKDVLVKGAEPATGAAKSASRKTVGSRAGKTGSSEKKVRRGKSVSEPQIVVAGPSFSKALKSLSKLY